jgi:hypothetical protein
VISRYLPGGIEQNYKKLRIAVPGGEISIRDLPNMKQEYQQFDFEVLYFTVIKYEHVNCYLHGWRGGGVKLMAVFAPENFSHLCLSQQYILSVFLQHNNFTIYKMLTSSNTAKYIV